MNILSDNSFYIIESKDYVKIQNLADDWQNYAGKMIQMYHNHPPETGSAIHLEENVFAASKKTNEWIRKNACLAEDSKQEADAQNFYFCMNRAKIEGILVLGCSARKIKLKGNFLDIQYLSIDPAHIVSTLFPGRYALRGVGSHLLTFAEQVCLERDLNGIYLQPLASSLPFYFNRGYERQTSSGYLIKPADKITPKNNQVA